jgi:hypothetical protein
MSGLIVAISSAAVTAGGTAASFYQAGQQKRKQREYEADAQQALNDARRRLSVNYADAMSVFKDPYEQERLAMLSAGAQLSTAAAESRRGASNAAGTLLANQNAGQQSISNRQGLDLQNIQTAQLEEESRLRDLQSNLDLQELAGQQQAASDAQAAAALANKQGVEGIANTAKILTQDSVIPLYGGGGDKTTTTTVPGATDLTTVDPNVEANLKNMPQPFLTEEARAAGNAAAGASLNPFAMPVGAPPTNPPTLTDYGPTNLPSLPDYGPTNLPSRGEQGVVFPSNEEAAKAGYAWDQESGRWLSLEYRGAKASFPNGWQKLFEEMDARY